MPEQRTIHSTCTPRRPIAAMACLLSLCGALLVLFPGCSRSNLQPDPDDPFATLAPAPNTQARPLVNDSPPQPAAIIETIPITRAELFDRLAEQAGSTALTELALETQLSVELAERNLSVTQRDIEHERELLARSLSHQTHLTDTQIEQILAKLRRQRGLGPQRFASLLRRNAMLRKLVGRDSHIDESDIELAYTIAHGPRVQIRLIVVADQATAASIRRTIANSPPAVRELVFINQAIAHSTDPSAKAGGLVEPFSPADPTYDAAIRKVIEHAPAGSLSPVVGLETGFAICYIRDRLPPDGVPLDAVHDQLTNALILGAQQRQMDQLAHQLLERAHVKPIDPSLRWSWRTHLADGP